MIFEHTDSDGDKTEIAYAGPDDPAGSVWHVATPEIGAFLDRAAIERLAHAAFREITPTTSTRIMPEPPPGEVSYPDDGRRVAALKAAAELLPNVSDGIMWSIDGPLTQDQVDQITGTVDKYKAHQARVDDLIKVAEWIIGVATWTGPRAGGDSDV